MAACQCFQTRIHMRLGTLLKLGDAASINSNVSFDKPVLLGLNSFQLFEVVLGDLECSVQNG